jgi:hypothetical protein
MVEVWATARVVGVAVEVAESRTLAVEDHTMK